MEQRIDIAKVAPEPYRGIMAFDRYLGEAGTARSLVHLVRLRMAQLDGCDYTHEIWAKNFVNGGGDSERIEALADWRNSSSFSERELVDLTYAVELAHA